MYTHSRILLLFFLLVPFVGKSQVSVVDSLYQLMHAENLPDSSRERIGNKISRIIYFDTSQVALAYLDEKGFPEDSVEAICLSDIYSLIAKMFYFGKSDHGLSLFWNTKAKKLLQEYYLPERQAELAKNVGFFFLINGMYEESIHEYLDAALFCKSLGDTKGLLNVYEQLADLYEMSGYKDESEKYWKIIENAEDSVVTCVVKNRLLEKKAWEYYNDNQYKPAIACQLKLIELNDHCFSYLKRHNMLKMARFYISAGKYKKAKNTLDAVSILDMKEDSVVNELTLYYYGSIYMDKKKHKLAIANFTACVELAEAKKTIKNWPLYEGYKNLAVLYKKQGNGMKAEAYLEKLESAEKAEQLERDLNDIRKLRVQLAYFTNNSYPPGQIEDVRKRIEKLEKKLADEK